MPAHDLPRLYLVRHASTILNAQGRLRGRLDPLLDETGRAEARATANVLARLSPSRIVSSPLQRAVETAEAIASNAALSVVVDERLADRDYGPWAGSIEADVIAQYGSVDLAPGVESTTVVIERARACLDDQVAYLGDGSVVLVSHDAVNRLLLTELDPDLGRAEQLPQATACWNTLARDGDRWRVERVDEHAA